MNAVVSTNSTSSIANRMELLFAILNEPMAKVTPQKSHPANGGQGVDGTLSGYQTCPLYLMYHIMCTQTGNQSNRTH